MLNIVYNATSAPMIVCDICGDAINSYQEGAAVFSARSGNEPQKVKVLHVHKHDCHEVADKRYQGGDPPWQELGQHLYMLLCNTGIDAEDYKALAEDSKTWAERYDRLRRDMGI